MACTVEDFRARFVEFSDPLEYSDTRIQLFLNDAVLYMGDDEKRWCNKYDYAHCYLTAHLLVSSTSAEAGDTSAKLGPVSSKSAGGVSVSRAVVAKDNGYLNDWYLSTTYGQHFLNIRNTCFVGVRIANCL